ncbi:YceI family protein [Chryseobacterium oryctis]|uniref:YceI family protein n=1 Tax=Chryseobacterium oryctis TaxID=2952618 RepID=A0ABT3HSI4_9FLAO|nr:YceI family protein [Chryseobacterium oryctis]MCW3162743.1 YceI family protein [Chryseobacterium oryctis]
MKKLLQIALLPLIFSLSSCSSDQDKTENHKVNETESVINWKGSAPDHFHIGSFKVTGELKADGDGKLKSGSFTIPISSIENYDLEDPVKKQLLDHLKSSDFFDMAVHPNAKFNLLKVTSYSGGNKEEVVNGANYTLTGDFTMIGQTHSISFPAKVSTNADGSLKVEAKFKIDRTKWGMLTDSDPAQPLYILPNVDIELELITSKAK